MPSEFYKDRLERRFPVTLHLLEHLGVQVKAMHDAEAAGEGVPSYGDMLCDCLLATKVVDAPVEDDALYLHSRVKGIEEEQAAKDPQPEAGEKRNFGGYFMQWLSSLDIQASCLFVANYDYDKAMKLYTEVDRDTVMAMIRAKGDQSWNEQLTNFESCLFGFGGSYGDGDKMSSKNREYDLKHDPEAANAAIRAMGF